MFSTAAQLVFAACSLLCVLSIPGRLFAETWYLCLPDRLAIYEKGLRMRLDRDFRREGITAAFREQPPESRKRWNVGLELNSGEKFVLMEDAAGEDGGWLAGILTSWLARG